MVLKKNVNKFNQDAENNNGIFSENPRFSYVAASTRGTDAINKMIPKDVKTIIDIGCADGIYTNEIKKFNPLFQITGIEPAENAVINARNKFKEINFDVAHIYDDNYFKDKHFDLAIFRGVIHHVSDPELAIKNTIIFADKMIISEPNGNNFILKLIERFSKYHREHEEQSFSTKKLSEWCKRSGWEIKSITYFGFIPVFFPTILSKIILFFQSFLEKTPVINKFFSSQIMIYCEKNVKH